MASITSVAAQSPAFIHDMIKDNHDRTYTVRLFNSAGDAQYITVDAELYRDSYRNTIYGQGTTQHEIWPEIIEKAFAQMKNGYANIESLSPTETMQALTGERFSKVQIKSPNIVVAQHDVVVLHMRALYIKTDEALDKGLPVIAETHDQGDGINYIDNYLVANHAYSVLRIYEEGGQHWVTLRNPWGDTEYQNGNYNNIGNSPNDGVFRIALEDYFWLFEYTYFH
jgi:hypothetical protein